ncbi:MAG: DUF58 domain-containing protein [Elusimicrobiota bacterium]|nr:DUF58 domain-containing protein [Endomicrobiia bacterium]MDW8165631.1 DUF58 domain-containing protein [Elusimicrobiota bacterium]
MIPTEILKQIRKIEFKTNKIVNELFVGQYSSVFKGRGMEFEEVREYVPGDDVRAIDWNVTARYGKLFIKKFIEERELTIMLLIDMSGSQQFGSQNKTKSEIVAEIACILALSALKNNDKVGAIIFTNQIELYIPAKKSLSHILRIIREILYYKPQNKLTDINYALEFFYRAQKKKCIVFLFSDFKDKEYEQSLKVVSKKHDLVLIKILDPLEKKIPTSGFFELMDIESNRFFSFYLNQNILNSYQQEVEKSEEYLREIAKKYKIDLIEITTNTSYIDSLLKFFYIREKRLR